MVQDRCHRRGDGPNRFNDIHVGDVDRQPLAGLARDRDAVGGWWREGTAFA